MRQFLPILLLTLAVSCSKNNNDDDPEIITCLGYEYPAWLKEMTKGISNCECPLAFYVGSHNDQVVFMSRVSGLCCGLDMVYDSKGTALFYTMSAEEYKKYLSEITGLREIWRCSKTGVH